MDDGAFGAFERFETAFDQIFARLRQDLNDDIVGDQVFVNQLTDKIKFGLRGRRKANLDLLQADFEQHVEKHQLLIDIHGVNQRLIAVTQIGRQPAWRGFDLFRRPGAIRHVDAKVKATIFLSGVSQHGHRCA